MRHLLFVLVIGFMGCSQVSKRQPASFPMGGQMSIGSIPAYVESGNARTIATCTQLWLDVEQIEHYSSAAEAFKTDASFKGCPRDNLVGFCETKTTQNSNLRITNQIFYYSNAGYNRNSARAVCNQSAGQFFTYEPN
jgi:hypothetical protein